MTKVYLVCARKCTPTGAVDFEPKEMVEKVFTNKKLADKCVEYLNQEWRNGFQRNANFKEERIKYFYRRTMVIEHNDYSKLPY